MAEIIGIKPLWDTLPLVTGKEESKSLAKDSLPVFEDIFRTAIDNVKQTDKEKNEAQYLLATGQLDSPATYMIAMNKAELSAQLLVQLRQKALDAYGEISRMNM